MADGKDNSGGGGGGGGGGRRGGGGIDVLAGANRAVNSCTSSIVSVLVVAFFFWVFLLASAQLNKSPVGNAVVQLAGASARMARTESFGFFVDLGSAVADGSGVNTINVALGGLTFGGSTVTTTAPSAEATPVVSTPQAVPTVAVAVNYVSSSPDSERAYTFWLGEKDGKLLPTWADIAKADKYSKAALTANSGDKLATWLQDEMITCGPLYNKLMTTKLSASAADIQDAISAGETFISECNPRVQSTYYKLRWLNLATLTTATPDEASGKLSLLLSGLKVTIKSKDGPARENRPQDNLTIVIAGVQSMSDYQGVLTVSNFNLAMLGVTWNVGDTVSVPGSVLPSNPIQPAVPLDIDLAVPTVVAPAAVPSAEATASVAPAAAAAAVAAPTTYTVESGDTMAKIARKLNVKLGALMAANSTVNPNLIMPGQQLVVPAP